ncbi:MAG: GNAT family N-acetyltransferase [Pirellula sp.]|nr:GNAT family N-acetyltransferase [Pirellula sp.]
MLQLSLVQNPVQWEKLEQCWDTLDSGILTRGHKWLSAWWNVYGSLGELRIFVAKRDDRVVAILPLHRKCCLFQGDTLCFLGSGRACSDRMGILSNPEDAEEAGTAFADYLLETSAPESRWDHLDLDGVRSDDIAMNHFASTLASNSLVHWERRTSPSNWVIPLVDGFDGYLASVSKRVRRMYRKAKEQLTQDCSFQVASNKHEAIEFLGDVEKSHQARWERVGESGCFANDEFHRFLCHAIESHWCDDPNNRLNRSVVIVRALVDGVTGAGLIGFVRNGVLSIYVTGMKPQFAERRLGWFTNLLGIEYAAKIGCIGVDLMRGDEAYKARLGARPLVQERWIISNPRWSSRALNVAYNTARNLREWAMSFRSDSRRPHAGASGVANEDE